MKRGKKFKEAQSKIKRGTVYTQDEAIDLVKKMAFAKFDETVDVSVKITLKKGGSVRDTIVLPHRFTKEQKVLVFAKGEKADEAREAGATYVGDSDLIDKIKEGWLDFDVAVATPDMMKDVGKLGAILGRRGLMPNPKTQTVTSDIRGALAELRKGRVEYRADKTGVVAMSVGKVSMEAAMIKENIATFLTDLNRKRPSDVKGDFIRSVFVSSTMGPGVKLNARDVV